MLGSMSPGVIVAPPPTPAKKTTTLNLNEGLSVGRIICHQHLRKDTTPSWIRTGNGITKRAASPTPAEWSDITIYHPKFKPSDKKWWRCSGGQLSFQHGCSPPSASYQFCSNQPFIPHPTFSFSLLSLLGYLLQCYYLMFLVISGFFFLISSGIIFSALHPIFSSSPATVRPKHD